MWKMVVGFVIFAAVAMFVLFKGGDSIDMGGEKHGIETAPQPTPGASQPAAKH